MERKRFGKYGGLSSMTFGERVVAIARLIPAGKVTTYGRIARAAGGSPRTAQSITHILSRAYDRGIKDIPFHRIVYSDGRIWVNEAYRETRLKKYKQEGIVLDDRGRIVDFEEKLFEL